MKYCLILFVPLLGGCAAALWLDKFFGGGGSAEDVSAGLKGAGAAAGQPLLALGGTALAGLGALWKWARRANDLKATVVAVEALRDDMSAAEWKKAGKILSTYMPEKTQKMIEKIRSKL